MKITRSHQTAFRFDPTVKASLALIAERDGRSMADMLECLIRKHCEDVGFGWPPEGCQSQARDGGGRAGSAKAGKNIKEKNHG